MALLEVRLDDKYTLARGRVYLTGIQALARLMVVQRLRDAADGFDKPVLSRYRDVMRTLANELKVPLVDANEAFMSHDPDKLLLDGMHPNDAGHALEADLLLPVIREQLR